MKTINIIEAIAILVVLLFALGTEVTSKFPYVRFTQWREMLCMLVIVVGFFVYQHLVATKLRKEATDESIKELKDQYYFVKKKEWDELTNRLEDDTKKK
jgi:uncharacterized membrane protein